MKKAVCNSKLKMFFFSSSWGRDCDELNIIQYRQNEKDDQYNTNGVWYWCDANKHQMKKAGFSRIHRDTIMDTNYCPKQYYVDMIQKNVPF